MPRYELLNNVAHKDLRVVTRFGQEFGDDTGMVQAFPTEFAQLQREYPIFFRKDRESGEYGAVALLGFEQQENLFLQGSQWNAGYLPGIIAKGPFLIGFQERIVDGVPTNEPVIHVDMDHPRVSSTEGERVFLPQGGHSPYLEHVVTVLRGIRDGAGMAPVMFARLDALGLIQPMALDIRLDESHAVNVTGLHGIDRDRLAALDAETVHELHRSGLLEGIYLVLASMHNVRGLMAEKQRRILQDEAGADHR